MIDLYYWTTRTAFDVRQAEREWTDGGGAQQLALCGSGERAQLVSGRRGA